jgi:hypothetical protein
LRAQDHFANAGPLRTVGSSEDQVVANLRQEFHRKMKEFVDALNDEHYRYDELTHHGLKRGEQNKQRRIQREQIETLTAKLQAEPNR